MHNPRHSNARLVLLFLAVLVVAILASYLLSTIPSDEEMSSKKELPAVPVTVGVDGSDSDAVPDTVIRLDRSARELVRKAGTFPERFDLGPGDLRGQDTTPIAPQTGPLATPNFPGCTTRILPTNWSSRTASVRAIGLHYTAGGNRPGLSDMNGLTSYASSPSAGVSWHFLIDAEGNCYYSVPLSRKAWTIGNLNSQTVNIEVIGRGNEPNYPDGVAGQKKLSQVVQRLGRIYNIPIRVGSVSNCLVTNPGVITHWQGGPCSGGHVDIKPYDLSREVGEIASFGPTPPNSLSEAAYNLRVLVNSERSNAVCLLQERRSAKRNGGFDRIAPSHLRRALKCKNELRDRRILLRELGLTNQANRKARYVVIGKVRAGRP